MRRPVTARVGLLPLTASTLRAPQAGGIQPSTWGNGNGRPYQATDNKQVLLGLYNKRIFPGKQAVVCAYEW